MDVKKAGGIISILGSSMIMFGCLFVLQGLEFEKYFMTYIILGLLSVLIPLFGWGVGIHAIAKSNT